MGKITDFTLIMPFIPSLIPYFIATRGRVGKLLSMNVC